MWCARCVQILLLFCRHEREMWCARCVCFCFDFVITNETWCTRCVGFLTRQRCGMQGVCIFFSKKRCGIQGGCFFSTILLSDIRWAWQLRIGGKSIQ